MGALFRLLVWTGLIGAGVIALLGRRAAAPQVRLADVLELTFRPGLDMAGLRRALQEQETDWELVDEGGDSEGGYKYREPNKCECGLSWNVNDSSTDFNQRPNQQAIAAALAALQYPTKPAAGDECDAPCVAVAQSRHERWRLFKNRVTGTFWLFCSKRVQWHCELVEG